MNTSTSQLLRILSEHEINVLGEKVFCDDEVGLAWTPIEEMPQEHALNRSNSRNATVLRAIAMLEEHDESVADQAERAEMHRLEGKLDLALELIAGLVRERESPIETRTIRFNSRGLCWDTAQPPADNALLAVEFFVVPPWPLSLKLYVRVVHREQRSDDWRICARTEGLSASVRDWFGKLVFRRHRRSVASQRSRN